MFKGLVEWLTQRAARPELEDPTFGHLIYYRDTSNADRGTWSGTWKHPEIDHELEIEVHAGISGPSDNQRKCFNKLRANLAQTEEQIAIELADDYLNSKEVGIQHKDILRHAIPVHVAFFDEARADKFDMRIYFSVDWDEEHGRACFFNHGKLELVIPE